MEYELECAMETVLALVDFGVESCQIAEVHNYITCSIATVALKDTLISINIIIFLVCMAE